LVEISNTSRAERNGFDFASAGLEDQGMMDEIEVDLKTFTAIGDRRSRQPTSAHVQGHLPPVIDHRRMGKPDLSHHLRPQMEGGARVGPV
jgi:hypothetical protein